MCNQGQLCVSQMLLTFGHPCACMLFSIALIDEDRLDCINTTKIGVESKQGSKLEVIQFFQPLKQFLFF